MPVGPVTNALPRKETAFDQHKRGPNSGTEWAGPNEEKNPAAIFSTNDSTNPNRHTQWSDENTPKGDPSQRPLQIVLEEKGFDCKVCNAHCLTMETFNKHCEPSKSPEARPREMKCEMDKRLFEEKNATDKAHMLDGSDVAEKVAQALEPALKRINDSFELVGRALLKLAGEKEPKAKKEKKRARARVVRRAAPARGPEPVGKVEPAEGALADPPAESASPE